MLLSLTGVGYMVFRLRSAMPNFATHKRRNPTAATPFS